MSYHVDIALCPREALFDIRGAREAAADCAEAVGLALPERPNSLTRRDGAAVLWLGPERWLLRAPLVREAELAARFADVVETRVANATLVSDMYTRIAVAGAEARDVLAQGCPLDTHPSVFAAGAATCTEIFGQAGIVARDADPPGFSVFVERSYTDFVLGRMHAGALIDDA